MSGTARTPCEVCGVPIKAKYYANHLDTHARKDPSKDPEEPSPNSDEHRAARQE